ncbi:hypothetical protein HUN01_03230 [Nostoc edaphicum CCNP1411]|uniref:Uncharacterized protein n=1 Tax=Nostoc edaphicum CCNP1411 TaxID=1472755 RepID=A0A7D7QZU5_9NOSO|nr:hypothetical protein [Nostoc edaphicum]QMS86626.1 hypothetical protein HUN01_03230 [Nostoc edaphicum CCNP1411]
MPNETNRTEEEITSDAINLRRSVSSKNCRRRTMTSDEECLSSKCCTWIAGRLARAELKDRPHSCGAFTVVRKY